MLIVDVNSDTRGKPGASFIFAELISYLAACERGRG